MLLALSSGLPHGLGLGVGPRSPGEGSQEAGLDAQASLELGRWFRVLSPYLKQVPNQK